MNARQRGVALLTALILVAIAAIVATAIEWQSQLSTRRAVAVFTVAQSFALAEGAEALAGYALRNSRKNNPQLTAPNQDWAAPYGPVEIEAGAVLEASLEDQAGKFNLNSVVMAAGAGGAQPGAGGAQPGAGDAAALAAGMNAPLVENDTAVQQFEALLAALNIDTSYATRLVDWIDTDNQPTFPGGGEDSFYMSQTPPHRVPNMPLTSISELLAMGMDRASYEKLKPFVTALPPDTKLNICTAPGEVLDAMSGSRSYAIDPKEMVAQRAQFSCYPTQQAFLDGVPANWKAYVSSHIDTRSSYFRLRTWITIGTTRFTLYSLIRQDQSGQIRPILRTFGTE
ncbi:MAG TPA: type II secretion system minor pseudopilin GspK [Steroidobacteraceae bacterium]|nr:type II secretion system minor pseudopilin GspK [Steroidobacteraceae bacterium]